MLGYLSRHCEKKLQVSTKQSQDFSTRLQQCFAPCNDVEFYLHSLNIA
ncbi:hypothetical protein [Rickettsia felis]|nr:hypothetical protein [Rickettsia felis]